VHRLFALVLALALLTLRTGQAAAAPDTARHERLVLPNGIRVLLVSDPGFNVSAASLVVGVGSLADPPARQGLAHFLEHMVFLGTEKYPEVADFDRWLGRNGGFNNAYTADDRTHYMFEIRHDAFDGALDRFAQFFITPRFAPEFTEREVNAVHSEHQKNLENDLWREQVLRSTVFREGHPARQFGTGSRDTLGGTTREELLAFHRQHYGAEHMTLVLASPEPVERLAEMARRHFAAVPRRERAPLRYDPGFLPRKAALRVLRMEPVKEQRHLTMSFALPDLRPHLGARPAELMAHVLGHEAEGSVLAQLKREGLAHALQAGFEAATPDYGSFELRIGLTEAGLERHERVLAVVFAALAQVRREGLPPHLFDERKRLAGLDERFRDRGEGARRTVPLANAIMDHGLDLAERAPFLWDQPDAGAWRKVLDSLVPDNLLVTLVAKGLPTDRTEPWYGTRYSYRESSGAAYAGLVDPPAVAGLALPRPNPFLPAHTALRAPGAARLIDEPGLTLYHAQDREFLRPLSTTIVRFVLPRQRATLRDAVMLRLYGESLNEVLAVTLTQAGEAGLQVLLRADLAGVHLTIDGYDEAAARLLQVVGARLTQLPLDASRFGAMKDRVLRELGSFTRGDAYQVIGETRRRTLREFHWRPDDQLALARRVTLADVQAYARTLYRQGRLEALAYGNLDAEQARSALRTLARQLGHRGLPEAQLLRRRTLASPAGGQLRVAETLQGNNSAWLRSVELGRDGPATRALAGVLSNFLQEPFYSELRTRQQLGYIVGASLAEEARRHAITFVIQSSDHPADELEARADETIRGLPAQLAALGPDAWQTLVGGARAKLEEKDKSVAERAARLFDLAFQRQGAFDHHERSLQALQALTQAEAAAALGRALDPAAGRQRNFLGFARQHKPTRSVDTSFSDLAAWKRRQRWE
jgi:insulysin